MFNDGDHTETNSQREVQQPVVPKLQIQALMGEMQRLLRAESETVLKELIKYKKRYD